MGSILELLPLILKLVLVIIEKTKTQSIEERKKFLADFDDALNKAKTGDPKELSKWLGRHL